MLKKLGRLFCFHASQKTGLRLFCQKNELSNSQFEFKIKIYKKLSWVWSDLMDTVYKGSGSYQSKPS